MRELACPSLLQPNAFEFLSGLRFLGRLLDAINSSEVLLRLAQAVAPPSFDLSCVRFFTAPLRALSPLGLFTAIVVSRFSDNARPGFFVPNQELLIGFGVSACLVGLRGRMYPFIKGPASRGAFLLFARSDLRYVALP